MNDYEAQNNSNVTENKIRELELAEDRFLKDVSMNLDLLWEVQKARMISLIKIDDTDLPEKISREQAAEIKNQVMESILNYWKKSKTYDLWIEELIGNFEDILELSETSFEDKFEEIKNWLEENNLEEKAGCYCFIKNNQYLYVGKAEPLGRRLVAYQSSAYVLEATHIRIIVPNRSNNVSKLERLLILNHEPLHNKINAKEDGHESDEFLEIIKEEVDWLLDG